MHQEFMRQFSIYGKTWKIVSEKMKDNGVKGKDQLQCRTHGQKYLLSITEIMEKILKNPSLIAKTFDKKMYQKLQRYQDDKRYLFGLYLKDKCQTQPSLDFQTDKARKDFLLSIPGYIKEELNCSRVEIDNLSDVSDEQLISKLM